MRQFVYDQKVPLVAALKPLEMNVDVVFSYTVDDRSHSQKLYHYHDELGACPLDQ